MAGVVVVVLEEELVSLLLLEELVEMLLLLEEGARRDRETAEVEGDVTQPLTCEPATSGGQTRACVSRRRAAPH